MGSHAKLTIFLLLLMFSLDLSSGGDAGFTWAGTNLRNPPSEIIAQVKIRRLMEMAFTLDYDKDPGANPRHEPPKGGGH
uniref:Uncharacterized protein n=1 Tax=Rhizophora mucronata TaxID=61149 RepID=A0A2P2N7Y9_RHIMU